MRRGRGGINRKTARRPPERETCRLLYTQQSHTYTLKTSSWQLHKFPLTDFLDSGPLKETIVTFYFHPQGPRQKNHTLVSVGLPWQ